MNAEQLARKYFADHGPAGGPSIEEIIALSQWFEIVWNRGQKKLVSSVCSGDPTCEAEMDAKIESLSFVDVEDGDFEGLYDPFPKNQVHDL